MDSLAPASLLKEMLHMETPEAHVSGAVPNSSAEFYSMTTAALLLVMLESFHCWGKASLRVFATSE